MKLHHFIAVGFVFIFIGVSSGYAQQSAEQLYQSGLYKEEIEGDLDAAIKIYETIINEYPENRPVAAKTYLHIGLCYEKLGLEEAQKAYRKVVEGYPEQKQEVAMAIENLNRLLASMDVPHKPTFRKINIATRVNPSVKLSPDGKNLALVSDKKLWAMPLEGNLGPGFSGPPVQINTEGTEVDGYGLSWSNDGKWIAFNEFPTTADTLPDCATYVVSYKGGNPRKIIENFGGARWRYFNISLSPDGKQLAFTSVEDKKQHIYTVPVEGGNPKQLTSMEAREPVFSPDGAKVAYIAGKNIGKSEDDLGLWVMPVKGGTPQLVVEAAKAYNPVWSADGSMIAYLDRTQVRQIFIVRIDKTGQAVGNPISINTPEGTSGVYLLAGWTPENKIGTLLLMEAADAIYTLPVKGGQAAMILYNTEGAQPTQPRWSRDGKHILYTTPPEGEHSLGIEHISASGRSIGWRILASVPASGGNGKPLPGDKEGKDIRLFNYQGGNRVSPDGKMIIAGAWTPEDVSSEYFYPKARLWKLAIDGSESTQITKEQGPFLDSSPCWSPDGTKIAFVRIQLINGNTDEMGDNDIYVVDSSGGEPEVLVSGDGKGIFSLVWSPDGEMLAYFTNEKEPPFATYLNVTNIKNRESRIVSEVPNAGLSYELAWSPDSKKVAFNDSDNNIIKVVSISDGGFNEVKTGLADVFMYHFDWSPDGERFVFSGWKGGVNEFWFLEHFLPEEK